MVRLSIIIPFYNVEQYIAQCLDSVYKQDIPEEEYEVICVNDASPDKSRDIVLAYQKLHKNLVLIEHDVNKKLGAARNTGVCAAKGKYIWHVDSDDRIAPNCLRTITDLCDERQVEMLEFCYIGANHKSVSIHEPPRTKEIISGQEYLRRYYFSNFGTISPIWRRVYTKSFLTENNILSPLQNMGEDDVYALQVFAVAKRVSFEPKDWYIHRINAHSLVGEEMQKWSVEKWYEASLVSARNIHKDFQKRRSIIHSDICQKIIEMIVYDILYCMQYDDIMSAESKAEYWKLCRRDFGKNLFVFRYLGKKATLGYINNVFFKEI